MIKTPTTKNAMTSLAMGGGAGVGVFLGNALDGKYPTDKKASAGYKVATSILAFGLTAVVSANMPNGLANDTLVGITTGMGAEKLISGIKDYVSTTDMLASSSKTNDFISDGLGNCGCSSNGGAQPPRALSRIARPQLNYAPAYSEIEMFETTSNSYESYL